MVGSVSGSQAVGYGVVLTSSDRKDGEHTRGESYITGVEVLGSRVCLQLINLLALPKAR